MDIVVHLAGLSSPDTPFEHLLSANIVGTYNIFQAASETKVKRVIYASSAQTIERYPHDTQIKEHMPVCPKNLYGASGSILRISKKHRSYCSSNWSI
ncbi:TPA: NAD-dependent epimerase/dehydratase family protein [Vibrio alginolyticus]